MPREVVGATPSRVGKAGARPGDVQRDHVDWNQVNLPPLGLLWRYGGWWRWLILGLILGGVGTTPRWPLLGLGLLGCAAGLAWFFRNPSRTIASDTTSIISPVDGVVDDLAITDGSPWMQGEALRIGIFLSVLDIHATRAPISGTVRTIVEIPGVHRNALSLEAGTTNQRNEIWLSDAAGRSLLLRQIAGAVARRVVFAPQPGDTVRAGAVIGMIRLGSRAEVWLPMQNGYVATVWRGDRVLAGVTVLARVPHTWHLSPGAKGVQADPCAVSPAVLPVQAGAGESSRTHVRGGGAPPNGRSGVVERCYGGE